MCGVTALFRSVHVDLADGTLERMTDAVAHRGPDGSGAVYLDLGAARWTAALGHRRLAILDLSEAGRQPMGRRGLWLTYNGEIYNYLELRRELADFGHAFVSQTDTEVVLAAYDTWGARCFQRFRGMWGLVLVDPQRRVAIASRDRFGIKPLYLVRRPGLVAAVSEIKQLRHLPSTSLEPDARTISDYLAIGYEDPRRSFFRDVLPVPPGTYQEIDLDTLSVGEPASYWFPEQVKSTVTNAGDAAAAFRTCLDEAVRIHLRSDVPVGCALSGGLDSSAIAATIGSRVRTFSATFPGDAIDERQWVERVVNHIGSEPHYVTPTPGAFLDDVDDFIDKHDEPVGSLSQYAAYAVARLTRGAGVPVTLNGQGGDEILSGYWQSYFVHLRRVAFSSPLRFGTHLGGAMLPGGNSELLRQVPRMVRRYRSRTRADTFGRSPVDQARRMTASEWRVYEIREFTLPRLLKWDDRNFMAFSVEGRYPFLDHELVELCLSFAPEVLYSRGWTKEPLRRALADRLPRAIVRRRTKLGFETPQAAWLAGRLINEVNAMLTSRDAPIWRYADPRRARSLSLTDREQSEALFRLFIANRWLRTLRT